METGKACCCVFQGVWDPDNRRVSSFSRAWRGTCVRDEGSEPIKRIQVKTMRGVKERTATVTSSSSYAQYILANHTRPERAYHSFLKEVINVNMYNTGFHFNSCFWSQLLLQWTFGVSITSFEFSPFNWVKWNTVLHLTLNLKQWTTKQISLLILWRTYIKSLNAVTAEELQYKWICL